MFGPVRRLPLSLLLVLGLIAPTLVLPTASADTDRDRTATAALATGDEREVSRDARTRKRHPDVGAEVIGGSAVPQGRYSFLSLIQVALGGGRVIACSGSLIAPRFVLTAAHCVEDENGVLFRPEQFTLAIGRASFVGRLPAANISRVAAVSQHPAYDPIASGYDVAVLTLTEDVPANIAQPIPIVGASDTRFDNPGQPAVVAGWGRTAFRSEGSPRLMEAPLTVISDADCDAVLPIAPATEICASSPSATGCHGDSGGPLFAPQVGVAAAKAAVEGASPPHEIKAERKKHHKRDKHRKKQDKRDQRRQAPLPPIESTMAIQFGLVSGGGITCPLGGANLFTQLSAPEIRTFIASVIGR